MLEKKVNDKELETKNKKRPFVKSDFEAVLKSAIKPLKKEQGEKESAKT